MTPSAAVCDMRSNNTVAIHSHALGTLNYIRASIEAAGACAVLNAISAALGDEIFRRAPVTLDNILMALEHGMPKDEPLTAHI